RFTTEGLVKYWRRRSSFSTPVLSYLRLNFLRALSMFSPSLIGMIIIVVTINSVIEIRLCAPRASFVSQPDSRQTARPSKRNGAEMKIRGQSSGLFACQRIVFDHILNSAPTSFQLPVAKDFPQHPRCDVRVSRNSVRSRKVNINFPNCATV